MSLQLRTTHDKRPLILQERVAQGGEGVVWQTDRPGLLAKLYHETEAARVEKLTALIAEAPDDGKKRLGVPAVAWPLDLIEDEIGVIRGYLMARVRSAVTVHHLAVPRLRRRAAPFLSWYRLHETALALVRAVRVVHQGGAVIGDLRADNILIDPSGAVTLIDADSFQITLNGTTWPCPVGSEGTTPPELIGESLEGQTRTPAQDYFGLAVLIYLLLLGHHPYAGVWERDKEPPPLDQRVRVGLWPGRPGRWPISPMPDAPGLEALAPGLRTLFQCCFTKGHAMPEARPDTEQWETALVQALGRLTPCLTNAGHHHDEESDSCPWCAVQGKTKIDLFPPSPSGEANPPLRHKLLQHYLRREDWARAATLWSRNAAELAAHPVLPEEVRRQAADLAQAHADATRFEAAVRRPATPSPDLAALWTPLLAASPFAETLDQDGRPLRDHATTAKERAAALEAVRLSPPHSFERKAALAAAQRVFPPRHWELRGLEEGPKAVPPAPAAPRRVVVIGPPDPLHLPECAGVTVQEAQTTEDIAQADGLVVVLEAALPQDDGVVQALLDIALTAPASAPVALVVTGSPHTLPAAPLDSSFSAEELDRHGLAFAEVSPLGVALGRELWKQKRLIAAFVAISAQDPVRWMRRLWK